MQASTWRAGACIFEPEKMLEDLLALKSMPSPVLAIVSLEVQLRTALS